MWVEELRAPFFTASIIPILLGTAMAYSEKGIINWKYFILTLLGGVLLHAGTNVANDYFDHKSGNDEINKEFIRPFTGGSRLIQKGLLSPKEVLFQSLIYFSLGSLVGLYLAYKIGILILYLGIIGIISGFFYCYWASRGIGELLVGLNFGILMVLGSYYVQTNSLNWSVIFSSLPITFLIIGVLYINQFPDYVADKSVGKNHLVVRLGREKAVWGYIFLIISVYFFIILGVILKIFSYYTLLSFITLPLAIKAIKVSLRYYDNSDKLIPANSNTIKLHLFIGIILIASYFFK